MSSRGQETFCMCNTKILEKKQKMLKKMKKCSVRLKEDREDGDSA